LVATKTKAIAVPNALFAAMLRQRGYYIVSLGNVVRWLGQQAEALGVEVFAGFAGAEVLYDEKGAVRGVTTGNVGVGKDGQPTANFHPGRAHRKYTCSRKAPAGISAKPSSRSSGSTMAVTLRPGV
jgi:electron-transferring-flavoprotein dehydrogenase